MLEANKKKKQKKKREGGTYADENDELSEYVPSPRKQVESDDSYLKKFNVESENAAKIGSKFDGKLQPYSFMAK